MQALIQLDLAQPQNTAGAKIKTASARAGTDFNRELQKALVVKEGGLPIQSSEAAEAGDLLLPSTDEKLSFAFDEKIPVKKTGAESLIFMSFEKAVPDEAGAEEPQIGMNLPHEGEDLLPASKAEKNMPIPQTEAEKAIPEAEVLPAEDLPLIQTEARIVETPAEKPQAPDKERERRIEKNTEAVSPFQPAPEPAVRIAHEEAALLSQPVPVHKPSRSDNAKGGKPLITVIDERSAPSAGQENRSAVQTVFSAEGRADMSLSLETVAARSAEPGRSQGTSSTGSERFASLLSSQIAENAGEFVRAGSIILRDNNAGSINLVLHPENLGNVKISLKLADKLVSGHIIVSSQEAYNAFKNNIDSIRDAFAAGGFETSGFELSWAGSGEGGEQRERGERDVRKGLAYVASLDEASNVSRSEKIYSESGQHAVNVIA